MDQLSRLVVAVASGAELKLLSAREAEALARRFAGIPEEYLALLTRVGWGSYPAGFMVYNSPIDPGNVFDDETAALLQDVVLVGDDMQGVSLGYARNSNWSLVEIDSLSGKPESVRQSLGAYLLEWAVS